MSTFSASAYWGPRKETVDSCAERLFWFLDGLAACDPALTTWHESNPSLAPIDRSSKGNLVQLLERGKRPEGIGGRASESFGFEVVALSGAPSNGGARLYVRCGCDSWALEVANQVAVRLPEDLGTLRNGAAMARVLGALAACWEPGWAGVFSRTATDQMSRAAWPPVVDWLLYLRDDPGPALAPLGRYPVRRLGGLGWIVQIEPESPLDADEGHRERVSEVRAALGYRPR